MVAVSEEAGEGGIELTERKTEEAGESEEAEVIVAQYKISDPALVEALLTVTDILEALAQGKITVSEARAVIEEKVHAVMASMEPPKKEAKKKASKRRKKASKAS